MVAIAFDERRRLVEDSDVKGACTLDGRTAVVRGAQLDYATVRDDDGRTYQWSWETVRRIMAAGGNFGV